MGNLMGEEICDLCHEPVTYCSCWRCLTCEKLFPESETGFESHESADGEAICSDCLEDEISDEIAELGW